MNTERFLWPVIIAAGLHGALLLSFSAKNPPPLDDAEVTTVLPPLPPLEMTDPPEKVAGDAGAGLVKPLPNIPEILRPLESKDIFTIPIRPPAPAIERVKTLPENPTGPIGPRDFGPGIGSAKIPDIHSLDRVPRATVRPAPNYPPSMRSSATSGSVTVEFVVDTTGRVVTAEAVRWTHRDFVDPAVRAVLLWRFEPGLLNGRKVNFRVAVPIEFHAAP